MSIAVRFNNDEAMAIFNRLRTGYTVFAPCEKKNQSRFSDADLVTYDEVNSFDEIVFDRQTFFSAKSIVFPIRETLFTCQEGGIKEEKTAERGALVFLRACDIHAFRVFDTQFLENGDQEDVYYREKRERIKFCLIECRQGFENCFCASMGTNKTDAYSMFMRKSGAGYEVIVKDAQLEEYFPLKQEELEAPCFVEKNARSIKTPEVIDTSLFKNELWKEYTTRCIACGRCNISCPTCTCFTIQDIYDEEEKKTTRQRIHSACHVKEFGLLAGGHDFRTREGDRMRYKTLHKIRDFKKRHGFQMCTGCGRCDDVCPEYISMFKCIEKINQINQV